jgi:hypothetical protein
MLELWERSGGIGRLSQDRTDERGLLLSKLSELNSCLGRIE